MGFFEELRQQRWDDHRYYHHSRINQSLHLFSACCFLAAYAMLFSSPVAAAVMGWLLAMTSRQTGHFFFEPKDYDHANDASHEHKEDIKVGYNLYRKVVLQTIWALSPVLLFIDPDLFGLLDPHQDAGSFLQNLATIWIVIGVGAIFFRVIQLFFSAGFQTGLVWAVKIVTDPFHDLWLYRKSPLYLLKGELYDPIAPEQGLPQG